MKHHPPPSWDWPHPQTWTEVFSVIISLLIGFLALNYLFDLLKGALP